VWRWSVCRVYFLKKSIWYDMDSSCGKMTLWMSSQMFQSWKPILASLCIIFVIERSSQNDSW
jgi:hypothetical protein